MTSLRLTLLAALFAVTGAFLVSCGDQGSRDESGDGSGDARSAPGSVADSTYVVTGVTEKGERKALVEGSEIRIGFADGQLSVNAGCNSMGGRYTLEGTRLTLDGGLSMTDMGCDQALMAQDTWVAGLFAQPVQLTTGDDAALISGDVVLALADRENVHPDKPLEGPTWILDSIGVGGAGGTVSSVPPENEAQLAVRQGRVRLLNGCGTLSATGRVSGDLIAWGPGRATQDACLSEQEFRAAVRGSASYSITEDTLTITNGDHTLTFRAR